MHTFLRKLSFPSQTFGCFGLDKVSTNNKKVTKDKEMPVDVLNIILLSMIFPHSKLFNLN